MGARHETAHPSRARGRDCGAYGLRQGQDAVFSEDGPSFVVQRRQYSAPAISRGTAPAGIHAQAAGRPGLRKFAVGDCRAVAVAAAVDAALSR